MKIWLTKNSEVSIRDQLIEQITLGIASDDLKQGERLPSVRELARRFQIHPNTVSAAYRELAEKRYVEFRKGSGVYVQRSGETQNGPTSLDSLIVRTLAEAKSLGFSASDVHTRLAEHLDPSVSRKVAVAESDKPLCEIIVAELSERSGCEAFGIDPEDLGKWIDDENVVIAAMFDEREKVAGLIGRADGIIFLSAASVPDALDGRQRPAPDEIVAVVSGWQTFLSLGRLFLVAAKIDPDSILTRRTDHPDWQRGLESASIVIGDVVSARKLSRDMDTVVFRILSDESVERIRQAVGTRL